MIRPVRSALYIPAINRRAMEKAISLPCDVILFDLEDSVAPDRRAEALETLAEVLARTDYGSRLRLVRVADADDIDAANALPVDGIVLPKMTSADMPRSAHPLWVMMETPQAILNAAAIAAHPAVAGLILGTNDLERCLNLRPRADRLGLLHALSTCVLAAKAADKPVLDGVHAVFRDIDGLQAEALQGRDLGFDGKTVIHPAQIDTVNRIFSPSGADVDLARRQIAAHEAAMAGGNAVAVLDGRIVEGLHVEMAKRTLALAEAIRN